MLLKHAIYITSKPFLRSLRTSGLRAVSMSSFYDFSAETLNGKTKPMSDYKGKVVLIENTATL